LSTTGIPVPETLTTPIERLESFSVVPLPKVLFDRRNNPYEVVVFVEIMTFSFLTGKEIGFELLFVVYFFMLRVGNLK
jgi:hypothetical protein